MRAFVFAAAACVGWIACAAAGPPATAERPDIHVFVVNGADPFLWAGTDQLAGRIRESGYPNTRHRMWGQSGQVEAEVRQIHRQNPGARVVLIGYSTGAFAVRNTAARLVRDGIPVAMVGYVGGDYFSDSAETRLGGVGRVINVTGDGHYLTGRNLFFNGTDITGAANLRLAGVGHFDLPRHPDTLGLLLAGLEAVATRDR